MEPFTLPKRDVEIPVLVKEIKKSGECVVKSTLPCHTGTGTEGRDQ